MNDWCRRVAGAGVLAATVLVASCGGGDQVSTFRATRIIAFGDEMSLIVDVNNDGNGRKYTVNSTTSATDPTLECSFNKLWIQIVADFYDLVLPHCNHAIAVTRRRAASGRCRLAGADPALRSSPSAASSLRKGDLATVMLGQNYIFAIYAQFPAHEAQLNDAARGGSRSPPCRTVPPTAGVKCCWRRSLTPSHAFRGKERLRTATLTAPRF